VARWFTKKQLFLIKAVLAFFENMLIINNPNVKTKGEIRNSKSYPSFRQANWFSLSEKSILSEYSS